MRSFRSQDTKEAEHLLFENGLNLALSMTHLYPKAGMVVGYVGKGHHAADALVALKILRDQYGWNIGIRLALDSPLLKPITHQCWSALEEEELSPLWFKHRNHLRGPLVLLDGLFDIGEKAELSGPFLDLAAEMNYLRNQLGARIISIDIPSGMDANSGCFDPYTVIADQTLIIGSVNYGALLSNTVSRVGAIGVVSVNGPKQDGSGALSAICPQYLSIFKERRSHECHKGIAGKVGMIAGSDLYPGAAALAARAALRAGAGLVTVFTKPADDNAIRALCPPEVIVRSLADGIENELDKFHAWVVGCGCGPWDDLRSSWFHSILDRKNLPVVIDADGLHELVNQGWMARLQHSHILTPHLGEFRVLAKDLSLETREEASRTFSQRWPATLLLKGSRTLITNADSTLWCNTTGHAGMATAGQGDALAGVIGALLAGGGTTIDSACFGAWLCGRAAEIATQKFDCAEESLMTTDVIENLGKAWQDWRHSTR